MLRTASNVINVDQTEHQQGRHRKSQLYCSTITASNFREYLD